MTPTSRGFASNYRIVLLALGLLASFSTLGVRLVRLHVVDREKWLATIGRTRTQLNRDQAKRGDILDADGNLLATSRPYWRLAVDPTVVTPEDEKKLPQLAALIGMPEAELRQIVARKMVPVAEPVEAPVAGVRLGFLPQARATAESSEAPESTPSPAHPFPLSIDAAAKPTMRPNRWTLLRDAISEDTLASVQELGFQRCIVVEEVFRRVYPGKQLAAHLVGYVNREQQPAAGVEAQANFYLRGQDGWSIDEKDGRGRTLAQFSTREVPPANGYSVVLSLKSAVQDVVEKELDYIARQFQPKKASIVVSDPRTGFILGMANYPTFDLNEYNQVPREEMARMKNVAVTDVYEPGSVFKIVAAAAAIEENLVTPHETFDCSLDKISYRGRMVNLPDEAHRFDHPLSVAEIISHSSNKGAAQLAMKVGEERYYEYARAFGFGRRLGFPVGGEVSGTLPAPKSRLWDGLTISRLPMGHAVDCTVLQMHQAMSAIANGGVLMRPQIIDSIRDASGASVYRFESVSMQRVVSERTAKTMAAMLMGVTQKGGTAPTAAIEGYDVAGKTGTTQKLIEEIGRDGKPKLVYTSKRHVASFVGFFPANVQPGQQQVAISVIVDDAHALVPGALASGASVAAPSFKNIGQKLIPILNITPASPANRPSVNRSLVAAHEGGRR